MQNLEFNASPSSLVDFKHTSTQLLRFYLADLPRHSRYNHDRDQHNYNTIKHLLSHLPASSEKELLNYILFESPQLCRILNRYYKIKGTNDGIYPHWKYTDDAFASCYFFGVNLHCENKQPMRRFCGSNIKNRDKIFCSDCFENLVVKIDRRQTELLSSDAQFSDKDQYVRIPFSANSLDRSICCNCSIIAKAGLKVDTAALTEIANIFVYAGPPNKHNASIHALCEKCFEQLGSLQFQNKCPACGCNERPGYLVKI